MFGISTCDCHVIYITILGLLISGLSRPVVTPSIQELYASHTASISCYFIFCPVQYLSWNGTALHSPTASERVVIVNEDRQSVLVINYLLEEDEGQYYCSCNGLPSALSALLVHRESLCIMVPLLLQRRLSTHDS